jgi:hypothetical protein
METISAFASKTQGNQENLYRGGRSQDLPNTGFSPAVRQADMDELLTDLELPFH